MLSKEQQNKLDNMAILYGRSMKKIFNIPDHIIKAWQVRYRVAMEQVLQRQGKR